MFAPKTCIYNEVVRVNNKVIGIRPARSRLRQITTLSAAITRKPVTVN